MTGTYECLDTLLGSEAVTTPKLDSSAPAVKFDQAKPDLTLLPRAALEQEAFAMMYGCKKYSRANYLNGGGMKWLRFVAACIRHLEAWKEGEDLDPESGLSHLGHARANLGMLIDTIAHETGIDNRVKPEMIKTRIRKGD